MLVRPRLIGCFNQARLIKASSMEAAVNAGNRGFGFDRRTVGISRVVGSRIFSIVGDLGFVGGLSRVFGLLLLIGRVRCPLRRRRRPGVRWEGWLLLVVGCWLKI